MGKGSYRKVAPQSFLRDSSAIDVRFLDGEPGRDDGPAVSASGRPQDPGFASRGQPLGGKPGPLACLKDSLC